MIRITKNPEKDFVILNLSDFQLTSGEWEVTQARGDYEIYP